MYDDDGDDDANEDDDDDVNEDTNEEDDDGKINENNDVVYKKFQLKKIDVRFQDLSLASACHNLCISLFQNFFKHT